MSDSLRDKAMSKDFMDRCEAACDVVVTVDLLELLSNDLDANVRGVVGENQITPQHILQQLSQDPDSGVRCTVARNPSTALEILLILLDDTDEYVRKGAKNNPNSKNIRRHLIKSSDHNELEIDNKKSKIKESKAVKKFTTQELTASLLTYSISEFKLINVKSVKKEWADDLMMNASSFPTYVGSPFDSSNLDLELRSDDSGFSENAIYVVPHYFSDNADYVCSKKIDSNSIIMLVPILGKIMSSKPMDYAINNHNDIFFEVQDTSTSTISSVAFYIGSKLVSTSTFSALDESVISEIILALNKR
jgi:hypothetical protein